MILAIIYTVAIPAGIVAAVWTGNAWSRRAVSNSDIAIGFTLGMLVSAVAAWIGVLLT